MVDDYRPPTLFSTWRLETSTVVTESFSQEKNWNFILPDAWFKWGF